MHSTFYLVVGRKKGKGRERGCGTLCNQYGGQEAGGGASCLISFNYGREGGGNSERTEATFFIWGGGEGGGQFFHLLRKRVRIAGHIWEKGRKPRNAILE